MHRILVTGGSGFIGSHVLEKLVEKEYEVTILDNLFTGKKENLSKVLNQIKFIQGDIRKKEKVQIALKNVDIVVHLAALISVPESIEKPLLYNEINSGGTQSLLNQSVREGVKKFLFISSCAVYGNPIKIPIDEYHPTRPLSPYAITKLNAEEQCRIYSKMGRIKTIVMRLFNVYGPRQTYNQYSGVITQFIQKVRNGEPPLIFGDGEQTRDFIFVDDVAEFINKAIETENEQIINIGTGNRTTINQLAEIIIKISKKNLTPIHLPSKQGEIRHSQADISKAIRILRYIPRTSLEEGLVKTMASLEYAIKM